MTVRQQWTVVGVIVAVVGLCVWTGVRIFGSEFVQITVGSKAPDFHAVTPDSAATPKTIADYKGTVTFVNIWATYCIPCEKEMPMLQQLFAEYQAKGLRLAAVSIDSPGMEKEIQRFVQRYGLTFEILYDSDGRIKLDYMTTGIPESFVIGKDGIIRYKQIGPVDERDIAQLRALLDQLLAE